MEPIILFIWVIGFFIAQLFTVYLVFNSYLSSDQVDFVLPMSILLNLFASWIAVLIYFPFIVKSVINVFKEAKINRDTRKSEKDCLKNDN